MPNPTATPRPIPPARLTLERGARDAMHDWMTTLASQYRRTRARFPEDELMIVFDIDGTILDMRHMVLEVLLGYDRQHGTKCFYGLRVEDITEHENHVARLLEKLEVDPAEREQIERWYLHNRWTSEAILASHRPYRGVLDIIRWFQLQPRTVVGLNTGRPESIRHDTLQSLNALGRECRVRFESELLYMNPGNWEERVAGAKADGLRYFEERGYRVFAVVDNEPDNIASMATADPDGRVLFLHADTLFESQRQDTPRTVSGSRYELSSLVPLEAMPSRVELVWHGVNDQASFKQFLASPVHWGECEVRRDPIGRLVLRHDAFDHRPWTPEEQLLTLEACLVAFRQANRSIKMDLKEAVVIDRVLDLLDASGYSTDQLWFNGNIDDLGRKGFRRLAESCPGAVIQSSVDFLCPLFVAAPEEARRVVDLLQSWGVNRFSVSWLNRARRQVLELLDEWGYEVNIYNVPDLESFLQAALLLPRSLTSNFGFRADPRQVGVARG